MAGRYCAYQRNCLASACKQPSRRKVLRSNGAATMHLSSWSMDGMKRACCQSVVSTRVFIHLQPFAGSCENSIPWRQEGLPLRRQAARLAAKLLTKTFSFRFSRKTLAVLRCCRKRAKYRPSVAELLQLGSESTLRRSECEFNVLPDGKESANSCRARRYSGQAQTT